MKRFVEYPLSDGGSIVVEVDESDHERGVARAATRADGIVAKSMEKFDDAAAAVQPAAEALLAKLRGLSRQPDDVTVEFGLKLTLSAGAAVIASTSGEGNFKVTLHWRRDEDGV